MHGIQSIYDFMEADFSIFKLSSTIPLNENLISVIISLGHRTTIYKTGPEKIRRVINGKEYLFFR